MTQEQEIRRAGVRALLEAYDVQTAALSECRDNLAVAVQRATAAEAECATLRAQVERLREALTAVRQLATEWRLMAAKALAEGGIPGDERESNRAMDDG